MSALAQPQSLRPTLAGLLEEIAQLRHHVCERGAERLSAWPPPEGHPHSPSARNLAHYLALREKDLRPLQQRLAQLGLSSLGRGEAHVLNNLNALITMLELAMGGAPGEPPCMAPPDDAQTLRRNSLALFGKPRAGRHENIMVTLPTQAASDPQLLAQLLHNGMECARINCAHDDPITWLRMIHNLRRASRAEGRTCRILMDLAGHKIRTGPLARQIPVRHLKVKRDELGRLLRPTEVLLVTEDRGVPTDIAGRPWLPLVGPTNALRPGTRLAFRDCRDKRRTLQVTASHPDGWLAQLHAGAYVQPGMTLQISGKDGRRRRERLHIGAFDGEPEVIRLYRDDLLWLERQPVAGQPARRAADGNLPEPASIACSHPRVLDWLKPGDGVWFDDGKLGTRVQRLDARGALLQVTEAGERGVRLRDGKGINFPDTELQLPPLSERDRDCLTFVCRHADMVGYSFVQRPSDMDELIDALAAEGRPDLPIIAKIETATAVRNLPQILLSSMDRHTLGVMIARGDLAVELGSVRMAEIQEEILWLCEAAHVPAIWATQVLETLVKNGTSSRPEITDAAMSVRAECVMLNKGPYVVDALRVLGDILSRMEAHQHKKTARLRALHW